MATCATMEQLQACVLRTIKLQMKFRKLAAPREADGGFSSSASVETTSSHAMIAVTPTRGHKLSQKAKKISQPTPERRYLYLMR